MIQAIEERMRCWKPSLHQWMNFSLSARLKLLGLGLESNCSSHHQSGSDDRVGTCLLLSSSTKLCQRAQLVTINQSVCALKICLSILLNYGEL